MTRAKVCTCSVLMEFHPQIFSICGWFYLQMQTPWIQRAKRARNHWTVHFKRLNFMVWECPNKNLVLSNNKLYRRVTAHLYTNSHAVTEKNGEKLLGRVSRGSLLMEPWRGAKLVRAKKALKVKSTLSVPKSPRNPVDQGGGSRSKDRRQGSQ